MCHLIFYCILTLFFPPSLSLSSPHTLPLSLCLSLLPSLPSSICLTACCLSPCCLQAVVLRVSAFHPAAWRRAAPSRRSPAAASPLSRRVPWPPTPTPPPCTTATTRTSPFPPSCRSQTWRTFTWRIRKTLTLPSTRKCPTLGSTGWGSAQPSPEVSRPSTRTGYDRGTARAKLFFFFLDHSFMSVGLSRLQQVMLFLQAGCRRWEAIYFSLLFFLGGGGGGGVVMVTDQTMVLIFPTKMEQMESVICSWVFFLGGEGLFLYFIFVQEKITSLC